MKNWVPYVAITAGATLLVKAVIVVASDDEVLTATTGWMYLVGLLLAAAAAVGYAMSRRYRVLTGVGLVLAIVAWVIGVGDLLTPLFEVFSDSEYLADEGPIGLLGVVLLGLGARGQLRSREPLPV